MLLCAPANDAAAAGPGMVRWADEATDTTLISNILDEICAEGPRTAQACVGAIARRFINVPYKGGTLEGEPEMLTVQLGAMDCTTFVDNVLALAKTAGENRTSWHDFIYNLENMRYRQGHLDGYASRLHYISDWAIDNSQRGNLIEITGELPGASHADKTLDFMSSHADLYPPLSDSATLEALKSAEMGYRSHRYPMVKTEAISKATLASLREGDVVALTTKTPGLDVTHLGFITIVDGTPHMLHASSAAGKILVDPLPLTTYLKRHRSMTGIRVFRLRN